MNEDIHDRVVFRTQSSWFPRVYSPAIAHHVGMTAPRSLVVDPEVPGFYHCVSRCVRRAFLCGDDNYSGRCFEQRKAWIEERLLELSDIFAVGIYAYAVMSNHMHVVTYVDPGAALAWSPEEVATRWVRLFPVRDNGQIDEEATRARAQTMVGNPERIAICRERLASLSWFMRCLSEPIARRANREDTCTGRFLGGALPLPSVARRRSRGGMHGLCQPQSGSRRARQRSERLRPVSSLAADGAAQQQG